MSKRKLDPLVQLSPNVDRRHYACRLRLDLWDGLKKECARLNCSQGVYMEILLGKALKAEDRYQYVDQSEVFYYTSQQDKIPFA